MDHHRSFTIELTRRLLEGEVARAWQLLRRRAELVRLRDAAPLNKRLDFDHQLVDLGRQIETCGAVAPIEAALLQAETDLFERYISGEVRPPEFKRRIAGLNALDHEVVAALNLIPTGDDQEKL